jgi:hypothetical protein
VLTLRSLQYASINRYSSCFAEKAPEKSAEVLQLEEFLFGKDIINAAHKEAEDEVEVKCPWNDQKFVWS